MTCEFCNRNGTTIYTNLLGEQFNVCDHCELDLIAADLTEQFHELKQKIIDKDLCLTHPAFKHILKIHV
ncbi:hypothetical protein NEF87_001972 [Candidatus Lokiarchaeum ossiferum]|uniref:Uncharacterized protein n=1 Tax=Candidatus Lokiarchaeum ossiferum TaxID=2951803 RepID=A0ABY6HS39_9ARCH|nr:hypothetical protein NEF87_001972 [Candidatus Lokiarchaeum sp. B-35]